MNSKIKKVFHFIPSSSLIDDPCTAMVMAGLFSSRNMLVRQLSPGSEQAELLWERTGLAEAQRIHPLIMVTHKDGEESDERIMFQKARPIRGELEAAIELAGGTMFNMQSLSDMMEVVVETWTASSKRAAK